MKGRDPGARRGAGVLVRAAAGVALLVPLLAGCGLFAGPRLSPEGLAPFDARLRRALIERDFDEALTGLLPDSSPVGDELLRLQHEGLVAHYAGEFERSNRALEEAERIAEDRYTKRISAALVSVVTSDRVLPYDPPPTERLFLHYYGALNYLELGRPDEAAVEARRLARDLDRLAEDEPPASPSERRLRRALRYLSGVVFEAAGDPVNADVAYRIARRTAGAGDGPELGAGPGPVPPDAAPAAATGEVVVVVERGFVPHRRSQSFTLFLWPDELDRLRRAGDAPGDSAAASTAVALARRELVGVRTRHRRTDEAPYLLHVAWPVLAETPGPAGVSRLRLPEAGSAGFPLEVASTAPGAVAPGPLVRADVAGSIRAEFRRRQPGIVAKAILRAVAKYGVVHLVSEAIREEDETLGDVAELGLGLVAALLEQADTRSWHLLPGRMELLRARLPAGDREITVDVAEPGEEARPRTLEVTVRPGGMSVVPVRVF